MGEDLKENQIHDQNKVKVEDEIDDLDDLLDDALESFSKPTIKKSNSEIDTQNQSSITDEFEKEFAKQLKLSMEENNPNLPLNFEEEFAAQLSKGMEELLKSSNNKELDPTTENLIKSTTEPNRSFQSTIDQTMNKLKNSSEQVKSEVKEENMDSFMEELMKQMEGLTDSPDFEKVIEGMIGQIMNKDLLYEPMKDLVDKYPEWFELNKDNLSKEDFIKYNKQYEIVKEVIIQFDQQELDDNGTVKQTPENTKSQAKVMELMQQMQELGQPPTDLLKMISPGLEVGEDGQPIMPKELEECSIM